MPKLVRMRNVSFLVDEERGEFWDQMQSGRWEATTLAAYEENLTPRTTFVDIGGWIGPTALFAASVARRVISLEPDPVAADLFHKNLALNPELAPKIEIIQKAIHSGTGTVRLGARTGRGDSMSSVLFSNSSDHWDVPTITPLNIANMVRGDDDVFIKVDIEGGEYNVLPEFSPLAQLPNVKFLIAFHPKFLPSKSLWSLRAAALTAKALAPFADYEMTLLKKNSVRKIPVFSALNKFGLAFFPVHHSLLLVRRKEY